MSDRQTPETDALVDFVLANLREQAAKPRLMAPWSNVAAPPSTEEHPDIPGLRLHYYQNRMGLLVPLWPKVGPIPRPREEDEARSGGGQS